MPTVSAVIATYNRSEELRTCLSSLLHQTQRPDRIMIIDDCATDNTKLLVTHDFPEVMYLRLPHNAGYIYARSLGLVTATSEWVLILDDDSWFVGPDGLEKALRHAEQFPDAGVLALNMTSPAGEPAWETTMRPFETSTHVGAGCLLRRAAAESVGLYADFSRFMGYGEEEDLSLRLLDLGWKTMALPEVVVYHAQSPKNRGWRRVRYLAHRNTVLRELLRCPLVYLPCYAAATWCSNTLYNWRNGYWLTDLKVVRDLPWMLWVTLRQRRPVSRTGYRRWRQLRRSGV